MFNRFNQMDIQEVCPDFMILEEDTTENEEDTTENEEDTTENEEDIVTD